jgi:hypothetical protein
MLMARFNLLLRVNEKFWRAKSFRGNSTPHAPGELENFQE